LLSNLEMCTIYDSYNYLYKGWIFFLNISCTNSILTFYNLLFCRQDLLYSLMDILVLVSLHDLHTHIVTSLTFLEFLNIVTFC